MTMIAQGCKKGAFNLHKRDHKATKAIRAKFTFKHLTPLPKSATTTKLR